MGMKEPGSKASMRKTPASIMLEENLKYTTVFSDPDVPEGFFVLVAELLPEAARTGMEDMESVEGTIGLLLTARVEEGEAEAEEEAEEESIEEVCLWPLDSSPLVSCDLREETSFAVGTTKEEAERA